MFTFISRFFGWLFKTRRRVFAICDGAILFACHVAAGSLLPGILPKYLVAFTDDHSDTDDDPSSDTDDPCDTLISCEKSPSNNIVYVCNSLSDFTPDITQCCGDGRRADARRNGTFVWLREKWIKWGLRRRSRQFEGALPPPRYWIANTHLFDKNVVYAMKIGIKWCQCAPMGMRRPLTKPV